MNVPDIFDRNARARARDRAASLPADGDFARNWMVEGLLDRLAAVRRDFTDVLEIGCGRSPTPFADTAHVTRTDPGRLFAMQADAVRADEDRLPFAETSFDLIVSAGVLDQIADLPGALLLARRLLRPDGLFLAAFAGAGSLPALRRALSEADQGGAAPRLHPQIDVRAAGDLLARAGFALPVADVETLEARYGTLDALLADLRASAATNILRGRAPLTRGGLERARAAFAALAEPDGRVRERLNVIVLTGWAPDASQPRPAKRGSATASLADALRRGS